jgi:hypothetical protein
MTQWDPASYDARHGFVHRLAGGVVELLDAKPGERILDADAAANTRAAALRPGGRRVAEFGGEGHAATLTTALRTAIGELARGRSGDDTRVADYVRLRVRAVKRASAR